VPGAGDRKNVIEKNDAHRAQREFLNGAKKMLDKPTKATRSSIIRNQMD
jgi:hypothetical protein